jgi:hypothetical protein
MTSGLPQAQHRPTLTEPEKTSKKASKRKNQGI